MPEPVSTTAALIGIFKSLRAGVRALRQGNLADEHRAAVDEIADLLTDAQDRLSDLQQVSIELREENAALRKQIVDHDDWQERLSAYDRVTAPGGAVVYQRADTPAGTQPDHYVCPACVERRELQILQDLRVMSGSFECPGCGNKYPVNPRQNPPRRKVVSRGEW